VFFHYPQNNSYGIFDIDHKKGIAEEVIIEAATPEEADEIAKKIGLYFDGVDYECEENGRDCPCCGDRWVRTGRGSDTPQIDGTPPESTKKIEGLREQCYIHYLDGRIEHITFTLEDS